MVKKFGSVGLHKWKPTMRFVNSWRVMFFSLSRPCLKIADLNQHSNPKRQKLSATPEGFLSMNLDDYLSKATIVDCNGQTAYEMTLLLNGDVLVCGRVGNYQINPTTRETTPVGKVVPVEIVEQAVAFARSCL